MALPPKGDPRRELALAIRSTRIVTWLFLILSLISLVNILPYVMNRSNFTVDLRLLISAGIPLLFVGFLISSIALRQRCRWAVTLLMVLSSITILGLLWFIFLILKSGESRVLVVAGFFGIWLAGMLELLFYLPKAKQGIDAEMLLAGQMHGFEPIMKPHQTQKSNPTPQPRAPEH